MAICWQQHWCSQIITLEAVLLSKICSSCGVRCSDRELLSMKISVKSCQIYLQRSQRVSTLETTCSVRINPMHLQKDQELDNRVFGPTKQLSQVVDCLSSITSDTIATEQRGITDTTEYNEQKSLFRDWMHEKYILVSIVVQATFADRGNQHNFG